MTIQTTDATSQIPSGIVLSTTEVTATQGVQYAASSVDVQKVKVRAITSGEIAMAKLIFKDAIDYSTVKVHCDTYLYGQDENTAITPNGELYFHPKRFKDDFSQEANSEKHWFIHEMTHVWQYQLGYPVKGRGALRFGLNYQYDLAEDKLLKDYNMEAQGDLVADYFVLKFLNDPNAMIASQRRYANDQPLYEKVLSVFLADPKNPDSKPGGAPQPRLRNND